VASPIHGHGEGECASLSLSPLPMQAMDKASEDPGLGFELEHAIGIAGTVPDGLHVHPNSIHFMYPAGSTVVVQDLQDQHKQEFLRGHDGDVSCICTSPAGTLVATGQYGDNSDVIVWDFKSRSKKFTFFEHDYGVAAVAISHDEALLSSIGDAEDKKMLIWDLDSGMIVTQIPLSSSKPVTCVTWGGKFRDIKRRDTSSYQLVTAGKQNLTIWELDPFKGVLHPHHIHLQSVNRNFSALLFSKDFETLYAGTTSGDFIIASVKGKHMIGSIQACSSGVCSMTSGSNPRTGQEELFVGGGDGSVVRFSQRMSNARVPTGHARDTSAGIVEEDRALLRGAVTGLTFTTDKLTLMASTSRGFVHQMLPYAPSGGFQNGILISQAHSGAVVSVSYPPDDSNQFATCALDGSIFIWDASDYIVRVSVHVNSAQPTCLAYSGDVILSGWTDGRIRSHDATNGELLWEIENAHPEGVTALALSNNQRFVITGGLKGEVRVWELRERQLVSHLKEHTSAVSGLHLFNDDVHAMSSSRDKSFLCWDLRAEQRISSHQHRMGGINSIALSGDQTLVLTIGQEKKLTFWDLREPNPISSLNHGDEAFSMAVSHNGLYVATGGRDHRVKIWDMQKASQGLESGALLLDGVGHSGPIRCLAFSPDDRQVVSVGEDGCVLVWNVFMG